MIIYPITLGKLLSKTDVSGKRGKSVVIWVEYGSKLDIRCLERGRRTEGRKCGCRLLGISLE